MICLDHTLRKWPSRALGESEKAQRSPVLNHGAKVPMGNLGLLQDVGQVCGVRPQLLSTQKRLPAQALQAAT